MKRYLSLAILVVLTAISFTSCLKDGKVNLAPGASPPVVEWSTNLLVAPTSAVSSKYALYTKSYALVPTVTENLVVNYTGGVVAPKDITVAISIDQAALDQYNTEHEDELDEPYQLLPASVYSLPTTVVIPKGQSRVTVAMTIKPDQFALGVPYALPVKLSTTDATVSGNYGTILLNIGVKNRIDGLYTLVTSSTTSLQPSLNHSNVPLVTVGANTVRTNLLDTYSNLIVYSIDPTTNKVTVVSVQGLAAPVTNPISAYDPVKKVLHIVWTSGARSFDETYTYTGVR